jgi:hypothetical protein
VGNEGPEWRAKNNTEQLSECSEELSEALSDIREPDEELIGPQPETVHMACIREIHHYQVDRDSDDGELHPEYEDEIIPCNDAQECGQNCESPVEDTGWSLRFQIGSRIQMKIALNVKGKMIMKMTLRRSLKQRKTPLWTNSNSK